MPIIPQTLNANNLRSTNAKSIKLQTIRKLIEYSLKKPCVKTSFTLTIFEILGTGSERVKNILKKLLVIMSQMINIIKGYCVIVIYLIPCGADLRFNPFFPNIPNFLMFSGGRERVHWQRMV